MNKLTDDSNNLVRIADPLTWNFFFTSEEDKIYHERKNKEYLEMRHDPKAEMQRKIERARKSCDKCWKCCHFPNRYYKCMSCKFIEEKIK